jgi:hypothetical protein
MIAMKTKTYTRRIARISFFSAVFFVLIASVTVKANESHPSEDDEMMKASVSLAVLNDAIVSSVRFIAPVSADVAAEYLEMEINAAYESLDELNNEMIKEARFEAPEIDINSEAAEFEVIEAENSLDKFSAEIERSIRYEAPAAE